jgi:hypothetical protein
VGSGFSETLQKAAKSMLMSLVTPGVVRVAKEGRVDGSVTEKGNVYMSARSVASADQALHLVAIQTDVQE